MHICRKVLGIFDSMFDDGLDDTILPSLEKDANNFTGNDGFSLFLILKTTNIVKINDAKRILLNEGWLIQFITLVQNFTDNPNMLKKQIKRKYLSSKEANFHFSTTWFCNCHICVTTICNGNISHKCDKNVAIPHRGRNDPASLIHYSFPISG